MIDFDLDSAAEFTLFEEMEQYPRRIVELESWRIFIVHQHGHHFISRVSDLTLDDVT
jgi:hypothetical protein